MKEIYKDVKITTGEVHQYLGMVFDFSEKGKCRVTMPKFTEDIVIKSKVVGTAATPATEFLYKVRDTAPKLDSVEAEEFHSIVASLQYLAKRTRPDILNPVVYLSTRVHCSDEDDWTKMMRVLKYLNGSKELGICLDPSQGLLSIHAYVDASFAVHHDMKSHTGIVVSFGAGGILFSSTKQKLNTTSSTEAELVGLSDAIPHIVHSREFLIGQGYDVGPAIVYQDNMSTMKLVENGRSNSVRTRHINIRFFFVKDRVDKGEIIVKHMPTDSMIADILTKPLQGEKFRELRAKLLNWY